jgi:hypothetical protein
MKTVAYLVLVFLVLLSLSLNIVLLTGLWSFRQAAIEAVDQSLAVLDGLADESFETTFHLQETVPVHADVPFRRELTVPVNMEIPISHEIGVHETFEVPIETPFFTFNLDVPVNTTIPVELDVPVHIEVPITVSETIPIHTDVEIDLTVPVAIEMSETPLPGYLEQLSAMLVQAKQSLAFGTSRFD